MTERRLAAILAADVAEFTAHMAVDEDGTLDDLQELRADTDPIIEGHGGRIASTAGDSIIAEFPSVAEAVYAAVEIQRTIESHRLRLRVGVNLGDVIVTADGDIFGDGVNIAARLQEIAEPGGLTVAGSVRDSLRGRSPVDFEDLGLQRLKHVEEPIRAYRALLHAPLPAPSIPETPSDHPELVERADELRSLRDALGIATSGRGRIVLIGGEAGIGKSSLVRGIAAEAQVDVVWGWCDDLVTPRPLGPFHDMALDLGGAFARVLAEDPRPEAVLQAMQGVLASGPPRVVIIEDLHWADDATIDALKFLARRIDRMPVLLVVTVRDVGAARVRSALAAAPPGAVTRLQLAPLSAAAIASLTGDAASAERVRRLTGGNPFFVSEVLVAGSEGVPASVQDSVLARLDSLSPAARAVVEAVSVGPTRLESDVVEALAPVTPDVLDEVETARLVLAQPDGLSFRHELARRAVEASLSDHSRRSLNAEVLRLLETRGVDPARLVHHAAGADDAEALVRHAVQAAKAAGAVDAHHQAHAHWQRVLDHDHFLDEATRIEALAGFAIEAMYIDEIDVSLEARERRLAIHRRHGDTTGISEDLLHLSRLHWYQGEGETAERLAAEAMEALDGEPSAHLARAYSTLSQLAMLGYRDDEAIAFGERAIALAEEFGDDRTKAHAMTNVGSVLVRRDPVAAAGTLRDARDLALEAGVSFEAARAWSNHCWNLVLGRQYDVAATEIPEALEFATSREHEGFMTYLHGQLAWLSLETGQWDEAEHHARESLEGRPANSSSRVPALDILGRLLARRGDLDGATALASQAWEIAEGTREAMRVGPVASLRAELAWLRGDSAEIGALWTVARPVLEAVDARRYVGELARWSRLSEADPIEELLAHPADLEAAGRFTEAAEAWVELGCPYDEAFARWEAGDRDRAIEILTGLGATAIVERLKA